MATFTNTPKSSPATFTANSKHSASWTPMQKATVIAAGSPLGLLLSLTYAIPTTASWTTQTKN